MNKILELKDIKFSYGNNLIFKDTSFSIDEGEFVAIVGENGTGKSTLMRIIIGELFLDSGILLFDKHQNIGYVPQLGAATSNNFPITIKEIMALNLSKEMNRFGRIGKEWDNKIDTILGIVDLKDKKESLYGNLSGGQKQKTMLGKALISEPKILLLDEPLIGLDEASRENFLELLHHQSKDHKITVLIITHDLEEISKYSDRVLKIEEKKVIEI